LTRRLASTSIETVSEYQMQRSEWVEQYASEFAAVPFVREFVFPNPQHLNKRLQKEVCDLLITSRGRAIVGQIKAQENPVERAAARLPAWIRKKTEEAAKQLSGSLKTLSSTNVWCEHARRGRVEFNAGALTAEHGLILVECGAGTRVELPKDLPLEMQAVPVAYVDASDFLNIVQQLRSFKDVERYLTGRRTLGHDVRRSIGGEQIVLEHYLLHGGTFAEWPGYEEARRIAHADRQARNDLFREKQQHRDVPASFVEYIADALAERLPNYTDGLDAATIALFDADESRHRYLLLQEVLADLSLVGRRQLGTALLETFGPPDVEKPPCVYRALHVDELPAFVFVALSTAGIPRQEVINRAFILLRGALTHYGWRDGMVIVDRDGDGFEVAVIRDFVPAEADAATAQERFAHLRVDHVRDRLV
jgi:hypothetical protein